MYKLIGFIFNINIALYLVFIFTSSYINNKFKFHSSYNFLLIPSYKIHYYYSPLNPKYFLVK